jgi:hypothetical protein
MVSFTSKQCAAPCTTDESIQCSNLVKFGVHCNIHHDIAKKMYFSYKNICEKARDLNIDKNFIDIDDRIKYLNDCYLTFIDAYNSRLEHRKYAFVPSMWDKGHDLQFTILMTKIKRCEELIEDLYDDWSKKIGINSTCGLTLDSKFDYGSDSTCDSETEIKPAIELTKRKHIRNRISRKNVLAFKKQRRKDDEDEALQIEEYISHNKELYKQKIKIVNICKKAIDRFLHKEHKEPDYIKILILYMTKILSKCDYFSPSYTPKKCYSCGKSNCFSPIAPRGLCKHSITHVTLDDFLMDIPEENVKYMSLLLLKNYTKMYPLVQDLLSLHMLYGDGVMTDFPVMLLWDVESNRLTINMQTQLKIIRD